MRHTNVLSIVLAIAFPCACADGRVPADTLPDTTSPSTQAASAPSSGRPASSTPAAAPAPIDSAARAACAAAAAVWTALPGATVSQRDTVYHPGDAIGDSVIAGWDKGSPHVACVVVGQLAQGVDSSAREHLSWLAPDGRRGRNGWGNVWRLSADGADGFVQTYQHGRTRCQLRTQWDPGDDEDSTYVPDPYYREEIACWRHGRDLVPIDTAQSGPG